MKPVSGNYCSHHLSSTKNHNFLSIVNYHEFTSTFSDALMEVKITMNLVDEQTLLNCNFCGYNAWVSQQFSKQSLFPFERIENDQWAHSKVILLFPLLAFKRNWINTTLRTEYEKTYPKEFENSTNETCTQIIWFSMLSDIFCATIIWSLSRKTRKRDRKLLVGRLMGSNSSNNNHSLPNQFTGLSLFYQPLNGTPLLVELRRLSVYGCWTRL